MPTGASRIEQADGGMGWQSRSILTRANSAKKTVELISQPYAKQGEPTSIVRPVRFGSRPRPTLATSGSLRPIASPGYWDIELPTQRRLIKVAAGLLRLQRGNDLVDHAFLTYTAWRFHPTLAQALCMLGCI